MICWVMYDIVSDRTRTKTAKFCHQAGLNRVQYSVFLGNISRDERDTLQLQIEEIINEDTDSVYIFPMSKDELKDTRLIGQAFDKAMITDEIRSLFL